MNDIIAGYDISVASDLRTKDIIPVIADFDCAVCGNCCRNFYAETNLATVSYFQSRGAVVNVCPNRKVYEDIKGHPGYYKKGLYILLESGNSLENGNPEDVVEIAWVGDCINLDEDNQCIDYENRPQKPCKGFLKGGEQCNIDREQINLPPLSIIPLDSIK